LDRETSGVVLLAKHRKAASYWQKGIEDKKVKRRYLAILRGEMTEELKVSNYLGNEPNSNVFVKQRVLEQKTNKAKQAETVFIPLLVQHGHTFCRVRTLTGRKHQIRVHAQWAGHPLVGEKLYGSDENIYLRFCEEGWQDEWLEDLGMRRQALHGEWLGFDEGDSFSASLPADMSVYLQDNLQVSESELGTLLK
jgi:23S rRNA pseudouridine1911/1915/1917 synthase